MSFELASAYVELTNRGFNTVTGAIDGIRGKAWRTCVIRWRSADHSFWYRARDARHQSGQRVCRTSAGAGSSMLKLAADAEQTEVAFTTMLGSADAAKNMLKELTSFAAATPFEMPGIKQAARTLLAFGTTQDQVLPLLKMLGDVSAGTGKDLAELSVIFGQISANWQTDWRRSDAVDQCGRPDAGHAWQAAWQDNRRSQSDGRGWRD